MLRLVTKLWGDPHNHKQVGLSDEKMNEILSSHQTVPEALRSDNFDSFIERRQEQLIQIVERVIGKRVKRDTRTEADLSEEDCQIQDEAA